MTYVTRPEPIKTDIRISWVVYEFATLADAVQFTQWCDQQHIEHRGTTTLAEARYFVWSRD